MGRQNDFIAEVECPGCHQSSQIEFQADVRLLEWTRFSLGDKLFGDPPMKGAPEGTGA